MLKKIRQHDRGHRLSHHWSRSSWGTGTWRAGSDAVRQILRQQAGIDLGNTIIADGSGLSRHNLIAPATMMQVLQYIAQHDNELNFISMLPLAGHDGSLQYRAGLNQAGVDGKVSAKTGSLQGVYNLAGFITAASGQKSPSYNTYQAMRYRLRISATAGSRWYASRVDCIRICTRTTNTKGRIKCGPFAVLHRFPAYPGSSPAVARSAMYRALQQLNAYR